jgi:hypothetical protein
MGLDDSIVYKGVSFGTGDDISLYTQGMNLEGKIYVCSQQETERISFSIKHIDDVACFVCQDKINGLISPNLLGYLYSYVFAVYDNGSKLSHYVHDLIKLKINPFQSYEQIINNAFPVKEE